MEFLPDDIAAYVLAHTAAEPELLKKIDRDTHAYVLKPRMLSGNVQGRFLSLISKLMQPKMILEVGTYTGYSALCLAEGLAPGGKLITMDINEELENRVRGYFQQAGMAEKIDYRLGNAITMLPELQETFDLVFIDADKENYLKYYNLIFDKVRSGGLILADNVLWSGKITQPKTDKDTRALQEFNDAVVADTRVDCMLLPLRDGIMMARKK
ncbi:MAG: methyltransferase domain-containing protein [Bacteroidetes bacterium CHB5]|nr:methyltransferase domain-containing protein [Bacteroidetes bacterium CHB5]